MARSTLFFVAGLLFPFLLSGCVAMEVAREVQMGRRALRAGNSKAAIAHFEDAARLAPDYKTDVMPLPVGVWTYLGRAYYESGDMGKAAENLKRAKERHGDDPFAPLYLGLVLSQSGGREEGRREIEGGLKGLQVWFETIRRHSFYARYWDPGRYLARTIEQTLSMLQAEKVDWKGVLENVKWLGQKLDDEYEEAKRMRELDLTGEGKEQGGGAPR